METSPDCQRGLREAGCVGRSRGDRHLGMRSRSHADPFGRHSNICCFRTGTVRPAGTELWVCLRPAVADGSSAHGPWSVQAPVHMPSS